MYFYFYSSFISFTAFMSVMSCFMLFTIIRIDVVQSFQIHSHSHHPSTSSSTSSSCTSTTTSSSRPTSFLLKELRNIPSSSTIIHALSPSNNDNNLIEEIKKEIDIISLIEDHNLPQFTRLSTEKATAICPFHNDHNPSLNIDKNKGLYKCFACGAGGDIFNFVRELDYVKSDNNSSGGGGSGNEKMSFPAAISYIATQYCSKEIQSKVQNTFKSTIHKTTQAQYSNLNPEQIQKLKEEQIKKERIIYANSVAADYYANLLITSPSAGSARSHLFQRGIVPKVVRTFALGYAPDAYFSKSSSTSKRRREEWGKGSLVERLEQMGFQPKEIVEAGLATVTSAAKNRLTSLRSIKYQREQLNRTRTTITSTSHSDLQRNNSTIMTTINNQTHENEFELQYYDIMDRFRGRLMVPIFDSTGKHILGFGGRDLDETKINHQEDDAQLLNYTKQQFRPPKYLNSPESLVFEKKNILFGLHTAKDGLNDRNKHQDENNGEDNLDTTRVASTKKATLIIVEGYFDAISLYGGGISEVTASMGAALTYQQLEEAAKLLGQGRVMDSDIERIQKVTFECNFLLIIFYFCSYLQVASLFVWIMMMLVSVQ